MGVDYRSARTGPEAPETMFAPAIQDVQRLHDVTGLIYLQQGFLSVAALHSYGGFADVNTGDYLGCCVATKRLRFWAEDVPDRVFKVLKSSTTSYPAAVYFKNSGFVRKS